MYHSGNGERQGLQADSIFDRDPFGPLMFHGAALLLSVWYYISLSYEEYIVVFAG